MVRMAAIFILVLVSVASCSPLVPEGPVVVARKLPVGQAPSADSRLEGFAPLEGRLREEYCRPLEDAFRRYRWGDSGCRGDEWLVYGKSRKGVPLVFSVWGGGQEKGEVTLVMCGVHGDEITPVKFCYDILRHFGGGGTGTVVLAPIVNPDSFFQKTPTRTNAEGVDINRNFPTRDWVRKALSIWKHRYGSDPRRYPGPSEGSEPETAFQVELIERFKPDKIISVHAPLTMLDYDGPESFHTGGSVASRADLLLVRMSRSADGYRIKNYPFFPGSLGNYAGNERNIPTFTLELPSSDYTLHGRYWERFKGVIEEAVDRGLGRDVELAEDGGGGSRP